MTILGQSNPERFFVKHIVLETDPNPRFVWAIANMIIPWEGDSSNGDVSCLKKELIKTGLFSGIESRLQKLKESDGYDLILTIQYKSPDPVYKLSKIDVFGIEGVDHIKFNDLLASERILGKPLSLKTADYAIFEDKLFDLLKKSIGDETKREWSQLPWVQLKLNPNKELEVTVLPGFKGCQKTSG